MKKEKRDYNKRKKKKPEIKRSMSKFLKNFKKKIKQGQIQKLMQEKD